VWHPDGTYLCVLAAKAVKAKKKGKGGGPALIGMQQDRKGSAGYSLELFRLKQKDVAVEVVEVRDDIVSSTSLL
jgi:hypothetical protein